jgi:hypothetical protein
MPYEPTAAPFPTDDYSAVEEYTLALGEVGVRLDITPDCPEEWATGDIGYFSEPGACGEGQFWRKLAGDVFVVMPDGREFRTDNVRRLAEWLLVRNRLPAEPARRAV